MVMRGAGDPLSIGERVAFYRRRRGLAQVALAGMVGRSEDWLSKIERGERGIRQLASRLRQACGRVRGVALRARSPIGDGQLERLEYGSRGWVSGIEFKRLSPGLLSEHGEGKL